MSKIKNILVNASIAFTSVALTLILIETTLRLVGYQPPDYVTLKKFKDVAKLYAPDSRGRWNGQLGRIQDFSNEVRTNSIRMHDTQHAVEKDPDTYRILFLGDSHLAAYEIPLEKTVFKILERNLQVPGKKVESISLGQSGSGPYKHLNDLVRLGLPYSPDMVLEFVYLDNDIKDDYYHLKADQEIGPRTPPIYYPNEEILGELKLYDKLRVFKMSRLNQLLAFKAVGTKRARRVRRQQRRSSREDWFIYLGDDAPVDPEQKARWFEAFRQTAVNLVRTKALCDAKGINYQVIFVDSPWRYDPELLESAHKTNPELARFIDSHLPHNRMKSIFEQADIPYFDLTPLFDEGFKRGHRYRFVHDFHWNIEGHYLAAQAVDAYLRRRVFSQKKDE